MTLPLMCWQLGGECLPERLLGDPAPAGFSLPGADALLAFADLLGSEAQAPQEHAPQSVPFSLPAMIPEDVPGCVTLSREIDFGALGGSRAVLTLDHIAGRGEILLNDVRIARFDSGASQQDALADAYDQTGSPCALCVDLSEALRLGRRQTLCIRFDETRPAGLCGPVFLASSALAHLSRVSIAPDAARRTMTLRARVQAERTGDYLLDVQTIPPQGDARETAFHLAAGEKHDVLLALQLDADAFVPGQAYAAPALQIRLTAKNGARRAISCDSALLMCGYPGKAPGSYIPLSPEDCAGDPTALRDRLLLRAIHSVLLPAPAPDCVIRTLCRAGIAAALYMPADDPLRAAYARYPNLSLLSAPPAADAASPLAAAWQLCGSAAFPRAIDPSLTSEDLFWDVCGFLPDPDEPRIQEVLAWLRAVQVRLRAEAARQGRYQGVLCQSAEMDHPDIDDALRTAFAPVHLSALPLCGAWWTGMRFSASLEAFLPEDASAPILAQAVLEDEDGNALVSVCLPCRKSGYVGVIEAPLPDQPCVLSLRCALLCGDAPIEESTIPVYVGSRGPLEAAFRA